MTIKLYDTLTRQKRDVTPDAGGRVTMYVCGPTVYNRAHIGNARPAVVFDVLRRLLEHVHGAGNVTYARNITDIDDKIMAAAAAEGVEIGEITRRYEDHYLADMGALGVRPPDIAPHATVHVPQMIDMIVRLIDKDAAYAAEGHVLFDVSADADYGQLSRRPLADMIAGARVEVAPYKRNPQDFVLWKPSSPEQAGWESPWGRGRPGWHIECSAMIEAAFGDNVTIHGGGLDLIFPHHENELAQSRCAHGGAPLADIWMHNGFLSMSGGEKMSKSLGNVVTVAELLEQGWNGEVIRLALLSAHYRQPLEWNVDLLRQSALTLDRWYRALARFEAKFGELNSEVFDDIIDDLSNDMAVSKMLPKLAKALDEAFYDYTDDEFEVAVRLHGTITNRSQRDFVSQGIAAARMLGLLNHPPDEWATMARPVFGEANIQLGGASLTATAIARDPADMVNLRITARNAARAAKNFAEADRIRDELAAQGIVLEDGPGGTTWRRA